MTLHNLSRHWRHSELNLTHAFGLGWCFCLSLCQLVFLWIFPISQSVSHLTNEPLLLVSQQHVYVCTDRSPDCMRSINALTEMNRWNKENLLDLTQHFQTVVLAKHTHKSGKDGHIINYKWTLIKMRQIQDWDMQSGHMLKVCTVDSK